MRRGLRQTKSFVAAIGFALANLLAAEAAACAASSKDHAGPSIRTVDPDRAAIAVEAAIRLQDVDLNRNAALKEAVNKLLQRTRGTPDFLRLVEHFKLAGQNAGLLELSLKNPGNDTGVEAMRLLLASQDRSLLEQTLRSSNVVAAIKTAEALGNAGDRRAVPLLLPIALETNRDIALRKQAVRALALSAEGAAGLLALARQDKLPDDLRFTASSELNRARWPEIKNEAAGRLPLPQGHNAQALPPLAELLKMKGNPANGAKVFSSASAQCSTCHKADGQGTEVGPNLSEVGSKLGKDAIYEAILDPNAGISFGYEAWTLELKSGDEAYGLIVSDSADEVALKDSRGIVTHYKNADIAERRPMRASLMPAGLQQAMTTQELADLVEYLASLKKPAQTE